MFKRTDERYAEMSSQLSQYADIAAWICLNEPELWKQIVKHDEKAIVFRKAGKAKAMEMELAMIEALLKKYQEPKFQDSVHGG